MYAVWSLRHHLGEGGVKHLRVLKALWEEKVKEAPKLVEVILERGACYKQPPSTAETTASLSDQGSVVLDSLRLIQNNIPVILVRKVGCVRDDHLVGCEHNVVLSGCKVDLLHAVPRLMTPVEDDSLEARTPPGKRASLMRQKKRCGTTISSSNGNVSDQIMPARRRMMLPRQVAKSLQDETVSNCFGTRLSGGIFESAHDSIPPLKLILPRGKHRKRSAHKVGPLLPALVQARDEGNDL